MNPDEHPKPDGDAEPEDGPVSPPSLIEAARAYSRLVSEWFKSSERALHEKEHEFVTQAGLGTPGVREDIAGITQTVQTLRSHQHSIYDRLRRGIELTQQPSASSRLAEIDALIEQALTGINRSIAAWLQLKEFFPGSTDDILSLLVELDRLRRQVKAQFPRAKTGEGSQGAA